MSKLIPSNKTSDVTNNQSKPVHHDKHDYGVTIWYFDDKVCYVGRGGEEVPEQGFIIRGLIFGENALFLWCQSPVAQKPPLWHSWWFKTKWYVPWLHSEFPQWDLFSCKGSSSHSLFIYCFWAAMGPFVFCLHCCILFRVQVIIVKVMGWNSKYATRASWNQEKKMIAMESTYVWNGVWKIGYCNIVVTSDEIDGF